MNAMPNGTPPRHFHAVRFHRNGLGLCALVTEYVIAGIAAGQPALIIATPEHQAGIVNRLSAAIDIKHLEHSGLLTFWDAVETLARLEQNGGRLDRLVFQAIVSTTLQQLSSRAEQPVRVYGEMVDVLWQRGLRVGALQLESNWNSLAPTHDFGLLCGYSASGFVLDRKAAAHVCGFHTHVLSDEWDEKLIQSPASPQN